MKPFILDEDEQETYVETGLLFSKKVMASPEFGAVVSKFSLFNSNMRASLFFNHMERKHIGSRLEFS
jgi:hypothetical protein